MNDKRPTVKQLQELRRLHDRCRCRHCEFGWVQEGETVEQRTHCIECDQPFPCSTRRAFNAMLRIEE